MLDQRLVDILERYIEHWESSGGNCSAMWHNSWRKHIVDVLLTIYKEQRTIIQPNEALAEQEHFGDN